MAVRTLTIVGFRAFSQSRAIEFAQPNGANGSGLTFLVGTNNAGKSTIIEALRYFTVGEASFSQGKRNAEAGDFVDLRLDMSAGESRTITSAQPGSSRVVKSGNFGESLDLLVLSARRYFNPYFNSNSPMSGRQEYVRSDGLGSLRQPNLDHFFTRRLFQRSVDLQARADFDELLFEILGQQVEWAIDESDQGASYLKFTWKGRSGVPAWHSSEGLGDGLVSLFVILDSLRDSEPGSTTVIDEPEASLHPQFQRRLTAMFERYSKDRQIVLATHSPYFVSWSAISSGAAVVRVHKSVDGANVASPSRRALEQFIAIGRANLNNPHMLGLDATEVLFLEGGIVLTEGQEDVVLLPVVESALNITLPGSRFGWGIGGAGNMSRVCALLKGLGYSSVVGLLDLDMAHSLDKLRGDFPAYHFNCIPANDLTWATPVDLEL